MNAECLLHMQAELSALEMSLNVMREDPDWNAFNSSWLTAPNCTSNSMVGDIFDRARALLDQYCAYAEVPRLSRG